MHQAQVLVYEADGKLAESLRALSGERGFRLRELRKAEACLSCLRRHGDGVLVLRLGRDLERELSLLERVVQQFPQTAAIVVAETANPSLAALSWDLGAHFALFPPQPLELLPELVTRCLPRKDEHAAIDAASAGGASADAASDA
jgi:DNA-binding NtrC family response regulator